MPREKCSTKPCAEERETQKHANLWVLGPSPQSRARAYGTLWSGSDMQARVEPLQTTSGWSLDCGDIRNKQSLVAGGSPGSSTAQACARIRNNCFRWRAALPAGPRRKRAFACETTASGGGRLSRSAADSRRAFFLFVQNTRASVTSQCPCPCVRTKRDQRKVLTGTMRCVHVILDSSFARGAS